MFTDDLLPNETLLLLLQQNNFYEELNDLLLFLHLDCNFEIESPNLSCSGPLSSQSHQMHYNPNLASNASNINMIVTTPGLVKNTALFVNNLLCLAPVMITEALHEHQIVRSYFRCLCSPPLNLTDLKLCLAYIDVMEMCISVCALLTRCILISEKCRNMCLNTRDCLHVVISLLNPALFGKFYFNNILIIMRTLG